MKSSSPRSSLAFPTLALVLTLTMVMPGYAHARYLKPHLQDVPVKRLLSNLEGQTRENPNDQWLKLNLARAYAMAYALNSDQAKIMVETKGERLAFWRAPFSRAPVMPQSVAQTPGGAARNYLLKAIEIYGSTLVDTEPAISQLARLGHGWCLEQSGDKTAAMADYRVLVSTVDWSDASAEAAGYLITLLDPKNDATEIATLRERLEQFGQRPRPITPLAIPLKANTPLAEIEDPDARVAFDVDGRGMGQRWSWITPKAGWLAYDPKQTGKISSGIRLFGSVSYWMFWQNGYQALAALDDNSDGMLSGQELAGIVVWVDENRNGVCDSKEIKPLAELHIKALRYSHKPLAGHPDQIAFSPDGVVFSDGTSAASYDIVLHPKP